jgi:hypothetical protein
VSDTVERADAESERGARFSLAPVQRFPYNPVDLVHPAVLDNRGPEFDRSPEVKLAQEARK